VEKGPEPWGARKSEVEREGWVREAWKMVGGAGSKGSTPLGEAVPDRSWSLGAYQDSEWPRDTSLNPAFFC
jgi:hypothetical protein